MKCPKCNYISFDYNLACPKCNKDVSIEQEKLNVPAFKPDPPSLLGGVLGDVHPGTHLSGSADGSEVVQEPALSIENASDNQPGEAGLDDSQEIDLGFDLHEDKGLEVEGILEEPGKGIGAGNWSGGSAAAKEAGRPEKTQILGTISLEDAKVFPQTKGGEEKEEITLDLDEITLETVQADEKEPGRQPDEKVENDLGDFSLEDAGVSLEHSAPPSSSAEGLGLDLNHLGSDDQAPVVEELDEITLSLEDLKVNETGELEIGRHIPAASAVKEPAQTQAPAMEAAPESPLPADKETEDDLSLLLSDDAAEISADPSEGLHALDLENLDLELDLDGSERK